MSKFKKTGPQGTMEPAVIQVSLTPEQIDTVARYTSRRVTALELSQWELRAIIMGDDQYKEMPSV